VIDVRVQYTQKAREDPAAMASLRKPMVLAEALARRIRQRVSEVGDLATAVQAYKDERRAERRSIRAAKDFDRYERQLADARQRGHTRRVAELQQKLRRADDAQQSAGEQLERGYSISPAYAALLGLTETKYRSSYAFHQAAGTKPGTFRVSGGMWSGLGVRSVGTNSAVLAFLGSTLGGSSVAGQTKSGRERSKPVQVRNQVKAGTVFRQSGVNVIQPKDSENEAMVSAVCRWSQQVVARTLGASLGEFRGDGDQQLLQDVLRLYDGSR
jgi:hypothetical protein